MDYKQESFYGMPDQNRSKMPFYMAYPMQTVYMEELEYTRDMEKLKGLYPKEVRTIQEIVEDECDKMEYDGSLMFDETPDRLMLRQITDRIYDAATGMQMSQVRNYEAEQYEDDMKAEELPMEGNLVAARYPGMMPPPPPRPGMMPPPPPRPGMMPPPPPRPGMRPPRDHGLQNLIEVLLYNEMYQRRCRHKRCRRWW